MLSSSLFLVFELNGIFFSLRIVLISWTLLCSCLPRSQQRGVFITSLDHFLVRGAPACFLTHVSLYILIHGRESGLSTTAYIFISSLEAFVLN
ncbi:hypothetical protein F5883DRAFT_580792 [Diaporthe sp. PMI_573]|nr:hypothetical protein F5883DRAFT_582996 [Diaporthaceae sp. PMI_573]KAH8749762.1 hypothetical protein F5883DRAFT_580792 [Diaporthaceae sp. PMI_573]